MLIRCNSQLSEEPCDYEFGDCFLYRSDACVDFQESSALILVDKDECEGVPLEERSCYGLPWFDATKDEEVTSRACET